MVVVVVVAVMMTVVVVDFKIAHGYTQFLVRLLDNMILLSSWLYFSQLIVLLSS